MIWVQGLWWLSDVVAVLVASALLAIHVVVAVLVFFDPCWGVLGSDCCGRSATLVVVGVQAWFGGVWLYAVRLGSGPILAVSYVRLWIKLGARLWTKVVLVKF